MTSSSVEWDPEHWDDNKNTTESKQQILELNGSGDMEINNLITITREALDNAQNSYCYSCYSNSCSYRGEINHLPWSTLTSPIKETKPSQDTFHGGSEKWKLSGNGCFTFQKKSIHLDVSLVRSQTMEHVKLILALKSCPQGASVQIDEIKNAFVTLHLTNEAKTVVYSKYIRISVSQGKSWKDLLATDDTFCTIEEFKNGKMCQTKPTGHSESEVVEFAQLQIELGIVLQPREGCTKSLTTTTCGGIHQDQINISLKSDHMSSNQIKTDKPIHTKKLQSSAFSSKFTEMVTIKVGSELQYEFPIHKHIIAERSPVFESMFEAGMLESKLGEVKLPDVNPEIMEAFLSLLYSSTDSKRILEDVELMVGILQLAHKYQIDDLVKQLIQILIPFSNEKMTIRDALQIYSCGFKLHISDLQARALQWFTENKEKGCLREREEEESFAFSEFIEMEKSAAVSLLGRFHAGFHPTK